MNVSYIRHHIKQYFPKSEVDDVLRLLREYDESPRPDFTYYAILRLADGDKPKLQSLVLRAKSDRDGLLATDVSVSTWRRTVKRLNGFAATTNNVGNKLLAFIAEQLAATLWAERFYGHGYDSFLAILPQERGFRPQVMIITLNQNPPERAIQITYYGEMACEPARPGGGRDVTKQLHLNTPGIETIQCSAIEAFDNIVLHLTEFLRKQQAI
jgi:hypothetical protein